MTVGALSLVVHGESGAGKSWLGDTAPAPRLILDAEGGSRFTRSTKTVWDPTTGQPPPQGTDTTVVYIRDFEMMRLVWQWLNSGQHDYNSVVLDSVTELQKRCKDAIKGAGAMRIQDWGTLLDEMEILIRGMRDLWMHPVRPVQVAVFITTTKADDSGTYRPHVQGQLNLSLPYFTDVVGYLYAMPHPETGASRRHLLVSSSPGFIAKDRTDRLGYEVVEPDIRTMLTTIYGEQNNTTVEQPTQES